MFKNISREKFLKCLATGFAQRNTHILTEWMKSNIRKISVSLETSTTRHRQIGHTFGIPSSNGSKKKGKRKYKTKP